MDPVSSLHCIVTYVSEAFSIAVEKFYDLMREIYLGSQVNMKLQLNQQIRIYVGICFFGISFPWIPFADLHLLC